MKQATILLIAALAVSGCGFGCAKAGDDAGARGVFVQSAISAVRGYAASAKPIELAGIEAPEPYAYSTLDAADRERYRILLDAFASREVRDYPDDDMDRLSRIRDCVLADHPELFSVESFSTETTTNSLTGQVTSVTVEGHFAHSAAEADEIARLAGLAAEECYAELPAGSSDYAKAKRAYEFLVDWVEYEGDGVSASASPDQTIEGALANRLAVCGGYANAFSFLLQSAGVQCAVVSGVADEGDHAWCLARLDGDYYYVDPTWGDPIDGSLNYDYLAITTADLEREHRATAPFALPRCTAVADNYYVREGLLLDQPDEGRFSGLVASGIEQVRCTDAGTYASLLDFITSGRLANRLGVNQYRYSSSDELLTLKVYLD